MARALTIAAGQLGTTAAAILRGANAPSDGRVDVVIHNTGASEETVVLTFTRAGGTARRLARAILQENEQWLVRGVPIEGDDTLLGVTSSASVVDYLIFGSRSGLSFDPLSANGTSKATATLRQLLQCAEQWLEGESIDPG